MPYKDPLKRKEYNRRYHSKWYRDHGNKQRKLSDCADRNLKSLYGFGLDTKQAMFDIQDGRCANLECGDELVVLSQAHVDHNHKTGTVRALLCRRCNIALGLLKDNPLVIRSLAEYVERFL